MLKPFNIYGGIIAVWFRCKVYVADCLCKNIRAGQSGLTVAAGDAKLRKAHEFSFDLESSPVCAYCGDWNLIVHLGFFLWMHVDSPVIPLSLDTVVVQVQQWEVVGSHRVVDQVLLNGFSLSNKSHEVDVILRAISVDAHLPNLTGLKQAVTLGKWKVMFRNIITIFFF